MGRRGDANTVEEGGRIAWTGRPPLTIASTPFVDEGLSVRSSTRLIVAGIRSGMRFGVPVCGWESSRMQWTCIGKAFVMRFKDGSVLLWRKHRD